MRTTQVDLSSVISRSICEVGQESCRIPPVNSAWVTSNSPVACRESVSRPVVLGPVMRGIELTSTSRYAHWGTAVPTGIGLG